MGRTSATQKLKVLGSVGIGPYMLSRRWTTQGAAPWRSRSRKERQMDIRCSFVRGGVGREEEARVERRRVRRGRWGITSVLSAGGGTG